MRADLSGQQAGQRGFTDAGWPPQDQRAQPPSRQQAGQRLAGADQVALAHHLGQGAWAQPLSQRRGRSEQSHGDMVGGGVWLVARGLWGKIGK